MEGQLFDNEYLISKSAMIDIDRIFTMGKKLLMGTLIKRVEGKSMDWLLSDIHVYITLNQ